MNSGVRKELALLMGILSIFMYSKRHKNLAALLGVSAMLIGLLPTFKTPVKKRTAMITGGSHGLGLALAQQLLKEGANVTLLARERSELERAQEILQTRTHSDNVLIVPCDITNEDELQKAFSLTEERFGRLDILINNAGTITVGPFESMDAVDFEALTRLQIHAVVHSVQLAIPYFLKNGEGQIVNISSIGGKLPVPHMSTYCAGKFGLAGFSESLGLELAKDNIHVTTVYPGLMRTGSTIQAVFKGEQEKEYAWFQVGDVSPFISVSASYAAKQIITGMCNRDSQVMFPITTKLAVLAYNLLPETYSWVMQQGTRFLPRSEHHDYKTGATSKGLLERQTWYGPFKRIQEQAETKWNQTEKEDAAYNLGI